MAHCIYVFSQQSLCPGRFLGVWIVTWLCRPTCSCLNFQLILQWHFCHIYTRFSDFLYNVFQLPEGTPPPTLVQASQARQVGVRNNITGRVIYRIYRYLFKNRKIIQRESIARKNKVSSRSLWMAYHRQATYISETYIETRKHRNWENTRNYVYLNEYLHKDIKSEVVIECYLCSVYNIPVIWWHHKCWSPVYINKLLPSSWRIFIVQSMLALLFCLFVFLHQRTTQRDGGVK